MSKLRLRVYMKKAGPILKKVLLFITKIALTEAVKQFSKNCLKATSKKQGCPPLHLTLIYTKTAKKSISLSWLAFFIIKTKQDISCKKEIKNEKLY